MGEVIISANVLQAVLNKIKEQPYGEVVELIHVVQQNLDECRSAYIMVPKKKLEEVKQKVEIEEINEG